MKTEAYVCAEVNLYNSDKMFVSIVYISGSGSQQNNEYLLKLMKDISLSNHSHKSVMGD